MKPVRSSPDYDVLIIGAGIVGLATAHQMRLLQPDLELAVLEKEKGPGRHQSGRNSGVMHSGLYYEPGSSKATMVARGRERLIEYCSTEGIAYELCGKVVVATRPAQIEALDILAGRGRANGLDVENLSAEGIRGHEPHVAGLAGLHVPAAGIVDFSGVCDSLARSLREAGHTLRYRSPVAAITTTPEAVTVAGDWGSHSARLLVNCAGLHSDRVASLAGVDTGGVRIMPFRGEFYELTAAAAGLVQNLVYPVPDPAFPFLGVHLTRMINGGIHAGPNAVLALSREGYRWRDLEARDLWEILSSASSWKLAQRHWRTGVEEVGRSLNKKAFLGALQELVPQLRAEDMTRSRSGVRAQALRADGSLVDDFVIREAPRGVHVLNAPSPAATAAFEIGAHIADLAMAQLA